MDIGANFGKAAIEQQRGAKVRSGAFMAQSQTGNLPTILNELWQHPAARRQRAPQLVDDLRAADWLVLGVWDCAATLGLSLGEIRLQPPDDFELVAAAGAPIIRGAVFDGQCPAGAAPIIHFRGTTRGVAVAQQSGIGAAPVSHEPAALLLCLQFGKYRLDSVMLQPKSIRDATLRDVAVEVGLDEAHMRALLICFPSLTGHI